MKNNISKIALFIAIPGGLFSFFWFLGTIYFGANAFYSFPQKLVILFQGLISFLAIWYYRKLKNEFEFTFLESFLIGFMNTLIVAIISSTFIYIYCKFYNPEIVTAQIALLKQYLIDNKDLLINQSNQAVYEGNLKSVDGVNAYSLALDGFIWKIVQGAMFSILCSLVLRRKPE